MKQWLGAHIYFPTPTGTRFGVIITVSEANESWVHTLYPDWPVEGLVFTVRVADHVLEYVHESMVEG